MSTQQNSPSSEPTIALPQSMPQEHLLRYVNLKLAALGQPTAEGAGDAQFMEITGPLLRNHHQKNLLLGGLLCPVDTRIQNFLDAYLADSCPGGAPRLPGVTFVLDRPGLARTMSLPAKGDTFLSPYLSSYRLPQGVLHNPKADRRTTQGIFHVAEGGLPVPSDKIEVPKVAFARLLELALQPPDAVMELPFTAEQEDHARVFVSLLLRPLVCPATASAPPKTMEIRFFAPGSLVSNLDFVEGIFGNGGDPYLPESDAALDAMHFSGHTGCVILAPHLPGLRKKELGLPHWDTATERQRRDGMCWRNEDELYNNGGAFKVTCRDERGVMVTVIADNYFGYCKKEVKTQISYAANLYGNCEEEHAGGALAFPSYVLGYDFRAGSAAGSTVLLKEADFAQSMELLGEHVELKPEGYGVDRNFPGIFYMPYGAEFSVREGQVSWQTEDGSTHTMPLRPGSEYLLPAGYRVKLEKQPGGIRWRLVGTRPDGTFCHKPCTVSGGGKSEISKPITGAIVKGPIFVREYHNDTGRVAEILKMDTASIYKVTPPGDRARRPILSPERSLGSVIKLLTPSPEYKDEYNQWLRDLPQTIRQFVCLVKRYYRPEWGDNWREHFTVDQVNGYLGHELKYENLKLVGNYLRVGFEPDGSWRVYKLRPDFNPAAKVQLEDDISASVTVPRETLNGLDERITAGSVKLLQNCEALLFQRPDDAIHRGIDEQAEADIASPGTFLSNFEPLDVNQARAVVNRVLDFDSFSQPMKELIGNFAESPSTKWLVSSAHPRLVDGVPTKNPRYLQKRPDLVNARDTYVAEMAMRLYRKVPTTQVLHNPVNAVLAGRRGNPPERKAGIPPLAVYGPIHYQELPELFMDFIASLTGKSPSTTGFGSEGALTKGPFNALPPVIDVNNALVAAILNEHAGFTTAAGYMGPNYRCDHDISMLVPEVWCRMSFEERRPEFLIANGLLEQVEDFEYEGRTVLASRLGYRITNLFADRFLGRIFETPNVVLTEEILRPEKQDLEMYVSGIHAITDTQARVARQYFEDGSVDAACPPVKALLHIMAHGHFEGMTASDPRVRQLFTREALLASDWYKARLLTKQQRDIALWQRHLQSLETFKADATQQSMPRGFGLDGRIEAARAMLQEVGSEAYLASLNGMLGADPAMGRPLGLVS
ncbi:MAG: hypothetical protein KIT83_13590 [Bryobacterales bacterium]|nr:hypothetical protein [Bryobacterales bacterium]